MTQEQELTNMLESRCLAQSEEIEPEQTTCPNCGASDQSLEDEGLYFLGSCFENVCPKCNCNFIEIGSTLDNPELFHNY